MIEGIQLKRVSFSYNKKQQILAQISLNINRGEFLGITGINGSGKSTFTYLLNGLIPHAIYGYLSGQVAIDGEDTRRKNVSYFARKVGMVFQNPDFSLFNLTVGEEIAFGLKNLKLNNINKRIKRALSQVDLPNFDKRDPQTLSLGEKQRVNLACVLALETKYIVLDEPTAQLDYKSAFSLYQLLKKLNRQGKTIIVVEHDTDFLAKFSQKTLILDKGKIAQFDKTFKVLSNKNMLNKLGIKVPHD